MAILGQAKPAAATFADVYTCPDAMTASVPGVIVCNQSGSPTTFRISVAPHGAPHDDSQFVYFDRPVGAGETFLAGLNLNLAQFDTIRCSSAGGSASFTISGVTS